MVEDFTFYLAGFDDIFSQSIQASLVAHGHAGVGQPPSQDSLGSADRCYRFCQRSKIILPVGPIMGLPDVVVITAFHAEIMGWILRIRNTFSAKTAANIDIILRTKRINIKRCSIKIIDFIAINDYTLRIPELRSPRHG